MSRLEKKISSKCRNLTSYEILEEAEKLSLGILTDHDFNIYMKEYRKALREEYIENIKCKTSSLYEITEIQNGYKIISRTLGTLTYYPKGDRLHVANQNYWLKDSGIEFLIKNVLH